MKLRTTALVAIPLSAVLLAGCGGSSPSTQAESTSTPTPTSSSATTGGVSGSSAKPSAGATATAGTDAAAGGTSAGPSAASSAPASGAPSAATFTAPGSYTYDARGTVTAGTPREVDGTAQLTVDKPNGDKQHSSLSSSQGGGTEQDVLHSSSGTYLVRLSLNTAGQNKEFRPAKPVLGHPRPAAAGKAWSWTMTSTDGKTNAAYSAKVVRRETITIGGTRVPTWVIQSTLKLTGDFTYTDNETTWYDDARLLQVKTHSKGKGNFSGIAFTTDITNTMRSVEPR